ncbi:MAG: NAD(P)/FAD-dependent oxidoreductase [Nitrospirae bacterium]|nr:NAD(P)/FAD-dependent oxidoreductase [Nitrospirota bacterium]
MNKVYDIIIIGAGLGGLTGGAFLSRVGKKVLVLEKSKVIGGRCSSRIWDGFSFDVGADYFAKGMLKTFARLDKDIALRPLGFLVKSFNKGKVMTIPPGLHLIRELSGFGMNKKEIAGFGFRMMKELVFEGYSKRYKTNDRVIDEVTDNPLLRNILNIGAFFSGSLPYKMPSYWFNLLFGRTYGYDFPFYPMDGAQRIPDLLAEVIRENGGEVRTNVSVEKIHIEKNKAAGVKTTDGEIEADIVISNSGIQDTVFNLVKGKGFSAEFKNRVKKYKPGLLMNSIFTAFKTNAGTINGVHLYCYFPPDIREMFAALHSGKIPDEPMFTVSVPDAVTGKMTDGCYTGTIKFITPRGEKRKDVILKEAERVIDMVDRVIPNFTKSIIYKKIVTSEDYEDEIGFESCIAPIAESIEYKKMNHRMPVKGIYSVGATVLPNGGCTASSVESGRRCAEEILG